MAKKEVKAIDSSTEERIKLAAHKLFAQKGYAGTKTRDIASEAGINLALLNYYFRSKEKLFELIMREHIQQFFQGMFQVLNDENTSIQQKIETLVGRYVDTLMLQPDIPIFVLSELRNSPMNLADNIQKNMQIKNSYFMKQIKEGIANGTIDNIHPVQLMSNLISLTVFPFIANPILKTIHGIDQEQFNTFMLERKKLIPLWIAEIIKPKTTFNK
ncbi:TetR/AcrR family transcriptional regulator [Solitalea sp. MAHUQ-68]|uniref:TetR/AcrR family transcriptional regulator n=1 Tax=Solitalea agri TaxID=2953739 RepID=A0A9X2F4Q0_9SPHI|nr:TetR/AcrR family transcriptional regulator [Solitalea agri]MCO4292291.1 TetR/AcrR family transcriptional regulator [Solitalea agri]